MKAKKLLAVMTAATMIVLPTSSAFAQTDLSGGFVTGDATINYLDTTDYIDIVVPTSDALAFTLDPQNLAMTQGVSTWNPSAGGSIIPAAVAIITNKSAIPVKTSIEFKVVDDSDTILQSDDTGLSTGTDRKMYLTVTPANAATSLAAAKIDASTDPSYVLDGGSAAVYTAAQLAAAGIASENILASTAAATATFGQFVCVNDSADPKTYNQVLVPKHADIAATTLTTVSEYNATTGGLASTDNAVAVTADGAGLAYAMDKAEYYVSKASDDTFSLVYRNGDMNDNYDTASFIIGGSINENADWSVYDDTTKIQLKATYSFTEMSDSELTAVTKLTGGYNSVEYADPDAAPSIVNKTTFSKATASDVVITYSLGSGDSQATAVTDFCLKYNGTWYSVNGAWGTATAIAANITIDSTAKTITIKSTQLSGYSVGSADIAIVFDDDTVNFVSDTITITE